MKDIYNTKRKLDSELIKLLVVFIVLCVGVIYTVGGAEQNQNSVNSFTGEVRVGY